MDLFVVPTIGFALLYVFVIVQLDRRTLVWTERHLRRILRCYAHYYNDVRTHRSLNKGAPISRAVQRIGDIKSHALLGGLHHHYVRI